MEGTIIRDVMWNDERLFASPDSTSAALSITFLQPGNGSGAGKVTVDVSDSNAILRDKCGLLPDGKIMLAEQLRWQGNQRLLPCSPER